MASKTVFLDYYVYLTDREDVDHMQTEFADGYMVAPDFAAAYWNAPIAFHGAPFTAPSVRSGHFIFGNNNYPRNVPTFIRKEGGWFGISWLFGDEVFYKWRGHVLLSPAEEPSVDGAPVEEVPMARRKWINGFELHANGESNGVVDFATGQCVTRDASRHADGFGLAIRGNFSTLYQRSISDVTGVSAATESWERFYIRVRRLPNVDTQFWRMRNTSGNGANLVLTTTGAIKVQSVTGGGGTVADVETTAVVCEVDTWYKLDLLYNNGTTATFSLYRNRESILNPIGGIASMVGAATHVNSALGHQDGTSTLEMDIDDWMCSEWPEREASSERFTGKDWLYGSKMQVIRPTGFNEEQHGDGWATEDTDWRVLLQTSTPSGGGSQALSSSTASDPLVVDTDAVRSVQGLENSVGIAALAICANTGNTTCRLGYRLNDAALVDEQVTAGAGWKTFMYAPTGVITPDPITALTLHFTKDSGGGAARISSLLAVAETIGMFGQEDVAVEEDVAEPLTIAAPRGQHNAPYPTSPWARQGTTAPAPIVIHSGTYTGNGTYQELIFRVPVNWLWIRRVETAVGGTSWWSSMRGPHLDRNREITSDSMVHALIDPDFVGTGELETQEQRTLIRIMGNGQLVNASGGTYQYVAVSDPAARFMLNGSYHHDTVVTTANNPFFKEGFTPEAAFFVLEDSGSDSTDSLAYKGVGHATDAGSLLGAAESADLATFQESNIITRGALHSSNEDTGAYSAWRTADGNNDPGQERVVQINSYTGDGTGNRTIDLTPASGRRPLFAIVVPHNAASFQRDPAHTGTNSSTVFGVESATAITGGGIDQITVGATLNANGIIYDVFVLPGGTVACNNGWSCDGEFIPVRPNTDPVEDISEPPPNEEEEPGFDDPDPDTTVFPVDPPEEFDYAPESERMRAWRLSNLCARVLHRLGDSDQKIWTESEIDDYIQQAMFQMVTAVRLVWDQLYLENLPPGFHCTSEFEEDLLEYEFQYGRAACTYEWELEYGEEGDLWIADDVSWANHTSPADRHHLYVNGEQMATAELPRPLVEIERVTWDQRTIEALSVRELVDNDSRFELTAGEVYGYTWRKDGVRTFRKVRKPNVTPDLVTHDGHWGIPRNVDDVSDSDDVVGTWGIPRRIRGWHPMGSTVGFGTERRFYMDQRNVKVEHWRKFVAECRMSQIIDGEYMNMAGEIPRHYFLYIADYCQWKALTRNGPGQSFKMAQLYKDRWDRNLGRLYDRVNRANNQRVYRLGGDDPSPRGKPPRPRLPWQYGSKVR